MQHRPIIAPRDTLAPPLRPASARYVRLISSEGGKEHHAIINDDVLAAVLAERTRQWALGHDADADDAAPRARQTSISMGQNRRALERLARIIGDANDDARMGQDRFEHLPMDPNYIDPKDLDFVEKRLVSGAALMFAALDRLARMRAAIAGEGLAQ